MLLPPSRPDFSHRCWKAKTGIKFTYNEVLIGMRKTDAPSLSPRLDCEQIPAGYKVIDANGQALAHVYARDDTD